MTSAAVSSEAERLVVGAGPERRPILCPYCGHLQPMAEQCEKCRGHFGPLSRQATQNVMGPWQVRNERNPFVPGVSYEMLKDMVARGKVVRTTVLRGPGTRQFWSLACNAPGVAVLLGECHNCHATVSPDASLCPTCGAVLTCATDRQHLGLGPVKPLPGEAPPHAAASGAAGPMSRPPSPAMNGAPVPPIAGRPVCPATGLAARRRARRRAESIRSTVLAGIAFMVIVATVAAVWIIASKHEARGGARAAGMNEPSSASR